jgi:hypothetical protein
MMSSTAAIDRELDTRVRLLELAANSGEKGNLHVPSEAEARDAVRLLFMAKQSGVPVSCHWHLGTPGSQVLGVTGGFANADGEVYLYRPRDQFLATFGATLAMLAPYPVLYATIGYSLELFSGTVAPYFLAVWWMLAGSTLMVSAGLYANNKLLRRFRRSAVKAGLAPEEARALVNDANRVRALLRAAASEPSDA